MSIPQDQIIKMACEAGFGKDEIAHGQAKLERFAALVSENNAILCDSVFDNPASSKDAKLAAGFLAYAIRDGRFHP